MDSVHKRGAQPPSEEPAGPAASIRSEPSGQPAGQPAEGSRTPRGADLARDALEAARARSAERRAAGAGSGMGGRNPKGRRAGSAATLRRRRWSGSGPDQRDPAPLGATLQRWVQQAGAGADLTKAIIFGRWAQIVGPEVAEHCQPVSLVDGELMLQAESTAWATQIRMLAGQIIGRINREVGPGSVNRIRAQGPSRPSWRFGPRHVRGRGPRDTYG